MRGLTLETIEGPLDWTAQTAAEVDLAGIRLAMLAARLRPDIVHLNSPALAASARFPAPLVQTCHSCVKTWWATVKGDQPLPADLAWRAQMTARGYDVADALIAPTRAFAEATRTAYDLKVAPRVVLNGRRPVQPDKARAEPEGLFAFTAGRLWDQGKGLAVLDRAAGRMSIPTFVAGALSGQNGAEVAVANVMPLGKLGEGEITRWLARRPVFVSAALYEPFGLAVLEAAQAGCALVLSDIDTFRELWDSAAIFIPPGDPAQIAGAVDRLAPDAALRHRMGDAARERAEHFTVRAMAEATLAIYREAIGSRQLARGAA